MRIRGSWAAVAMLVAGLTTGAFAPAYAGIDCRVQGDMQGQVRACTSAIAKSDLSASDRGIACLYRCQAHDVMRQSARALGDCLTAADLRPVDSSIYSSLSIVYRNLGRNRDAVDAANRAISLNDDRPAYYAGRAAANCKLGDVAASLEDRYRTIDLGYLKVQTLQRVLGDKGYHNGPRDGRMNRETRRGLRAWTEAGC